MSAFTIGQGLGVLEITGLGPALMVVDALDKAANVRVVQAELNDYYGYVVKIQGDAAALRAAVDAGEQMAARLHAPCVTAIIDAPDREALKAIDTPREYQPLIEQDVVFTPTHTATKESATVSEPQANRVSFAIGLIETQGFTAVIEAIDTACKAADVEVIGKEKLGGGYITVIVKGDVAAVEAAIAAGREKVGSLGKLIAAHVIARPSASVLALLPQ